MKKGDNSIILEPHKVYLVLFEDEESGLNVEVADTLEWKYDSDRLLAVTARGIIEYAMENLPELVKIGTDALIEQGVLVKTMDEFPETQGSA